MIQLISSGSVSAAVRSQIQQEFSDLSIDFEDLLKGSTTTNSSSISEEVSDEPESSAAASITDISNTVPAVVSKTSDVVSTASKYSDIISSMSQKYGVPEKLIQSVIKTESDFNPDVVSSAGAQGLMQLMPQTAKELGVTDAFDPKQNIEGGTKLLKQHIDTYGNLELVLAAYNAGPGAVAKYGGVPPYEETQNYIKKVLGRM